MPSQPRGGYCLSYTFSGAQGRFFHGFALSTHFRFEDGIDDGFVSVVGVAVGFNEGSFFRGEGIGLDLWLRAGGSRGVCLVALWLVGQAKGRIMLKEIGKFYSGCVIDINVTFPCSYVTAYRLPLYSDIFMPLLLSISSSSPNCSPIYPRPASVVDGLTAEIVA